ncbi:MAG: VWA domain-containing protein [Planctomycetes bacterium]|nr:VWA domain-containing protein [Planctomycetota bacterium]
MPDLSEITFAEPHHLPLLLACGAVIIVGALIPVRRHPAKTRWVAAGVRLVALVALGLVMMAPVVVVEAESVFEPQGYWILNLDSSSISSEPVLESDAGQEVTEFHESGHEFVERVRSAMSVGKPPSATIIFGQDHSKVHATSNAIEALGIPSDAKVLVPPPEGPSAVLTGIEAPIVVKPGEAFIAKFGQAGTDAKLTVTLDGDLLEPVDGKYEIRTDVPGKHVLEAVLSDPAGNEIQRAGHVFRVGDPARALAVGMTLEQLDRAATLAPDIALRGIPKEGFSREQLVDSELVLISVDTLNHLPEDGAETLAAFVATGGGLYITGDGAKYVAPEYMFPGARRLLPVLLRKEAEGTPDEDPPVEEEIGLSEITKVSICYVIDNSGSMDTTVGRSGSTRWDIAAEGVVKSIELIRKGGDPKATPSDLLALDTRVTVISFTLKQERVFGPLEVYGGSVGIVKNALTVNRKRDEEFTAGGYNTDIYAAVEHAIGVMENEKAAVKMIVMLTDGADNEEVTKSGRKHSDLRDHAIAKGINIMTIGIGDAFSGDSSEAFAARTVLESLATNSNYARIPVGKDVEKASAIFVEAAEVSFAAYDDKLKKSEEERKRRLQELKEKGKEPGKIDVMPGVFPLRLGVVGAQLFGPNALPEPAPRVQWLARNEARDGAAVALSARTDDGDTPALVFKGYGLGRVAFWGAGTDPQNLGELTGWGDFPAIFAASLRWLLPPEQPDLRLVDDATPSGIRILDPLPEADYLLRTASGDVPLQLDDNRLVGDLPLGPGEVIEIVNHEQRAIGDVYVAAAPLAGGRQFAQDDSANIRPLQAHPPEVTTFTREAALPILYLLTFLLLAMPVERLVRRRN